MWPLAKFLWTLVLRLSARIFSPKTVVYFVCIFASAVCAHRAVCRVLLSLSVTNSCKSFWRLVEYWRRWRYWVWSTAKSQTRLKLLNCFCVSRLLVVSTRRSYAKATVSMWSQSFYKPFIHSSWHYSSHLSSVFHWMTMNLPTQYFLHLSENILTSTKVSPREVPPRAYAPPCPPPCHM